MTQTAKPLSNSTAQAPDLDWSQIAETVRMLNLAVAQIGVAMAEGEDSVQALTASFTGMVGRVQQVAAEAARLPPEQAAIAEAIGAHCKGVQQSMQQGIVAFQFYDRLSQRIDHVQHALEQLAELIADNGRLYNPMEWQRLQQAIRGRYTMQEEQAMFDALLAGASVEEALEQVRPRLDQGDIDDIELF